VHKQIVTTAYLGKSFAGHGGPFTDPSCRRNHLVHKSRLFIIDLVPYYDPKKLLLHFRCRSVQPMCNRHVLHPTQVSHIIHVAKFVNIGSVNNE